MTMDDSAWMEKIEEAVFEERKVVTYKWLSRSLNVHVNVAKQMLFAFAEKHRDKVSLVYLVAGEKNNNIVVRLVKESDLSSVETFASLTSKHIHSVSAKDEDGKLISEINLLAVETSARKEIKPTNAYSAIINKFAVPRASRQIEVLTKKSEEKIDANKEIKREKPAESKVKKPAIQQMFDKEAAKKSEKPPASETSKPPASSSTAGSSKPAKGGSIAGLFARQAASGQAKKNFKSETKDEEVRSPGKENRMNKEIEKKEEQERKSKEKKEKEQAKKRTKKNAPGNDSKRRKRIQVASDSDSSDEGEQVEELRADSPPPPQATRIESDDEDIIPATPVEKEHGRRHHVKKMKKKTYVDEDGFMVTKMEMESCSEDSEPEPVKSEPKPVKTVQSPKKSTESKKGTNTSGSKPKQASIMNFFHKK